MSGFTDRERAIEHVQELRATYTGVIASEEEKRNGADYETRTNIDNYISGLRETAERLAFVERVLRASIRPRARRPPARR